jgi:hypothetical protein
MGEQGRIALEDEGLMRGVLQLGGDGAIGGEELELPGDGVCHWETGGNGTGAGVLMGGGS